MARLARAASQAQKKISINTQQQVENLLSDYGIIDDTPAEFFAQQYAQGMKKLLNGVYDVVDVHK